MNQINEFNELLTITSEISGIDKESLQSKDRSIEFAIPRAVLAVVSIKDALLKKEVVAKGLNRHRTATYHYLKCHDEFFNYHAPYRNCYVKVLKAYKNIDENKKHFVDKKEFKKFIKSLPIKNSKKPDIEIKVKANGFNYIFLSDCFNFTEDVLIIKKYLKGYKYNIDYNTYEG
jgi:hypothetical protein